MKETAGVQCLNLTVVVPLLVANQVTVPKMPKALTAANCEST